MNVSLYMTTKKEIMAKKSLSDIAKDINKNHGENALIKLDEIEFDAPRIPTGILAVDSILGGGLPKGKIAVISGREGSGKSSLATMLAAQAQKDGKVVYIDLENSFDPNKALNSGVDMDELFISQPRSAEETLEVIEACLGADDVSAIIVDSVAAMATKAQIAGDYSDQHVAGLARVLSLGMNKINQYMVENRKDTILLFVNQVRDIIGTMGGFGPTTTTPGGRALKFYASTILEAARIGNVKRGEDIVGQTTQITVKKSRFSAPFQKAAYDILFESGISNESTVVDLATRAGRLEKNKGWYTDLRTGEKFNGKANLLEAIASNPEYAEELYQEALTTIR